MPSGNGTERILFYCHDSYGLGHLRRTLTLASYWHQRWPASSQLIVTGSPSATQFDLPGTTDSVKLPSVVKVEAGRYEPRFLPIPFDDVWRLRRDIVFSAASAFQPAALIVDNVPTGLKGEIIPTLRYLKETGQARLVLGLRDIVDDRPRVVRDWQREGVYELLDELYDLIVIYGDPSVYDPVREYDFSPRAAAKTRYVGYLERGPVSRSAEAVRTELGLKTDRLVVVTAGGGDDGYAVLRAMQGALHLQGESASFDCLLVTGPLMSAADRRALRRDAPVCSTFHYQEFVHVMLDYVAAADVVVSMGGYNSVCEILSARRPAIIVPRVEPRREQLIRAEAMSRRGLVRVLHPTELTPDRLLREILELLERPPRRGAMPAMDGLAGAADALEAVLRTPPSRSALPRRVAVGMA
jgi:predicted glycosyltransferase